MERSKLRPGSMFPEGPWMSVSVFCYARSHQVCQNGSVKGLSFPCCGSGEVLGDVQVVVGTARP